MSESNLAFQLIHGGANEPHTKDKDGDGGGDYGSVSNITVHVASNGYVMTVYYNETDILPLILVFDQMEPLLTEMALQLE